MVFACDKCEKAFRKKNHLSRHKNNHSESVLFSCSECNRGFRRKDNLLRHQRTHTQERPYKCLKCKNRFGRKDHLQKHQRVYAKSKCFSCPECHRSFCRKEDLKKHQRTHGSAEAFIANVNVREIHKIDHGERSINGILQKRFSCTDCDKSFALQITFHRHQAVHMKRYLKNIPQGIHKSGTNYVTEGHAGEKKQEPFSFTWCDKSFSVQKGLLVHQRVHTQCVTCSECGKSFSLKRHLVKHQRIHSGHRQSRDGTSQTDKSCTAAAHAEYDNENKDDDRSQRGSSVSSSRGERGPTVLNGFNCETDEEKNNESKHPKESVLEAATVFSKKVILKAATFVFRSSLNGTM